MKRIAVALVALAVAAACTRIIQKPPGGSGGNGGNGGSGGSPPPPPPPNDLHVQALWMFNLPRSAVNLASSYAELHDGLTAALAQLHVVVDQEGVAAEYMSAPGLIWGQTETLKPGTPLQQTLTTAADSGQFEPPATTAPEQQVLARLGQQFGNLTIPPELVGGQSVPLYGMPRDGLLVVTVHGTRRLCADTDSACALFGSAPVDFLSAQTPDGILTWIAPPSGSNGYLAKHVIYLDVVTSEGEAPDAFRARCGAVPGFSRTLLDVLEPSPVIYFDDLSAQLGARGPLAQKTDLCDALGDNALVIAGSTASAIATRLASP